MAWETVEALSLTSVDNAAGARSDHQHDGAQRGFVSAATHFEAEHMSAGRITGRSLLVVCIAAATIRSHFGPGSVAQPWPELRTK